MKKIIQLTILLGVALFLLSACQTDVENTAAAESEDQTDTSTEEIIELNEEDIEEESTEAEQEDTTPQASEAAVVEITDSGFSPSTLTIAKGTTVTFTNLVEEEHWPASASHPSHTIYPTEGGCIGSTFDACEGLGLGESFEFTFDEVGEWNYHDHLNPSLTGTIVVE